jgi:uncharacterized protein (TIGR00369 family)
MNITATTERQLTVRWSDPAELEAAGLEMSGLEFWRAIAAEELPPPPIAKLMGFAEIAEVDEGRVSFAGTPSEAVYNPIGVVHGGYASTLLDSAVGCAVHTTLPPGTGYTTLELKVNFVRPITARTGRVLATGTVIHRGGKVATAEGRLVEEATGKLLAHATTTCLILRPE